MIPYDAIDEQDRECAEPLRSWRLVLCTEVDDFTCPRGVLADGTEYVFAAIHAGGDWPARVEEGYTYAVSEDRWNVLLVPFELVTGLLKLRAIRFRNDPKSCWRPRAWLELR